MATVVLGNVTWSDVDTVVNANGKSAADSATGIANAVDLPFALQPCQHQTKLHFLKLP